MEETTWRIAPSAISGSGCYRILLARKGISPGGENDPPEVGGDGHSRQVQAFGSRAFSGISTCARQGPKGQAPSRIKAPGSESSQASLPCQASSSTRAGSSASTTSCNSQEPQVMSNSPWPYVKSDGLSHRRPGRFHVAPRRSDARRLPCGSIRLDACRRTMGALRTQQRRNECRKPRAGE